MTITGSFLIITALSGYTSAQIISQDLFGSIGSVISTFIGADPADGKSSSAEFTEDNQYTQGFETDNTWGDPATDPTRVASGTNGITSKSGGFHAEAGVGDFTRWGGYNTVFPAAGYTTSVDIYLDVNGAYANDTRFDYTSAISKPDNTHLRDFVFNAGFYNDGVAPGTGNRFVVGASNNSGQPPKNPAGDPFVVNSSGWYTFKHRFYNNGSGVLAVQLSLLDSSGTVLKTWTRSSPTDIIGANVGGNRYGWFPIMGFPFLAIDNSLRANIVQDAPIVVTQNDLVHTPFSPTGWFFYNDENDTVNGALGSFVNGPGTTPLGSGSVQISVSGTQRRNLATYQFSGTVLANITELKYSTYNPSAGNGGSANRSGYLQFNVDFNGTDTWQRRLVYLPGDNGAIVQNAWQEWNAINGGSAVWRYSGGTFPAPNPSTTKTWAQILADYPGVRMRVTDSFLGIRVGEPYSDGYTENIDAFKFGVSGDTKVFDFERSPVIVVDADGFASTTDCNDTTKPATATVAAAVAAAQPGDTIRICSGTYTISSQIALNKAGLTLVGGGATKPVLEVPTIGVYNFHVAAPGVTLDNLEIKKTDLGSAHEIILVQANNFTAQNNLFYGPNPGGTWSSTGLVSRAFVVTGGLSGLLFDNNVFHTLRQPAYINGGTFPNCTTGTISNNNVSGTRGWVIDGASITFSGNTFGPPANQGADIAILSRCDTSFYNDIPALSAANDDAFVDAQFPGGIDGSMNVYVDDNAAPGGIGSIDAPFQTITQGVNGVLPGGTVHVAAGGYNEDVTVNKSIILEGAGVDSTTVTGPIGGAGSTFTIAASNVEIRNFKITRAGNNPADWYNSGLNSAGVAVLGLAVTGLNLHNNLITGMRTAIDINNSNGHTIRNNVINDNRTGLIFRNQTDNMTVVENEITNNWTVGVLFLDASSGSNSPVQTALNGTFSNNNISGNWYGQIVDRQTGGALPAPGTTNLKNFGGNWYGSTSPVITTANSAEPGYGTSGLENIPVAYGGTAVAPGGQPDIAGAASGNFDYSPYLNSGADTNVETTPTRGTYGFQGSFSSLSVTATSPQTNGTLSNIQEGINQVTAGGTLNILNGTYAGNVDINKVLTLKGTPTILGTLTASVAGARVSPGFSPGIINTGGLTMVEGSALDIELNGTTVGTGYDQVNVTGGVDLGTDLPPTGAVGGATLNLTVGFTPAAGSTFTIINNDGSDAVSGVFKDLPEGTVFFVGPNSFKISYIGGTGNDVVLTTVSLCNTVSIPTGVPTQTGTTVTVPVNVDDVTGKGLLSFDMRLNYDPAVINSPSVTLTPMTSGRALTVNGSPGQLIISVFGTDPLAGSGALLNITFDAVGPIGSSSGVNFTNFFFNEGTPCLSTSNGSVNIISGSVAGAVSYANSIPTKPVPYTILNGAGSVNVSTQTDLAGNYSLSNFGSGAYTVTPTKTGDVNGINSFDSALIAQHVVGLTTLNSTQLLAADVSNSSTVTSFDAALIARFVVLLPNSGSAGQWRFTPTSRSYPSGIPANVTGEDYTALLMGEVSGNWTPPTTFAPFVETLRDEDKVRVILPQLSAAEDSLATIPLDVENTTGKGIISYQFDLVYEPDTIEPQEMLADTAETLSSRMTVTYNSISKDRVRVVVFGAEPLVGKGTLLNLKFKVTGRQNSSSPLKIENFVFNENTQLAAPVDGEIKISAASEESVSVEGRLLTATGEEIAAAEVFLTDTRGVSRTAVSDKSGYFRFKGVTTGETYTLSVNSKLYIFTPQTISASEGVATLNLIAEP